MTEESKSAAQTDAGLVVHIVGSRTITRNDETFTVYRITCRKNMPSSVAKPSLSEIERRYNDFFLLQQELRRKAPKEIVLPDLPPKRFNNMSVAVVEERKKELQRYLNEITRLPKGYGRDTIEAFLGTTFSTRLDSDALNPYGWANRTQQGGALRTQYRRSSSNSQSIFESCALL